MYSALRWSASDTDPVATSFLSARALNATNVMAIIVKYLFTD